MSIVLAEAHEDRPGAERSFDQPVIRIGRDTKCDIVFNESEWLMVSRSHAEFRLSDKGWVLVDTKSRFGTFLNGRPVTEPIPVQVGARIQFGPKGPVLRIIKIESLSTPQAASPLSSVSDGSEGIGADIEQLIPTTIGTPRSQPSPPSSKQQAAVLVSPAGPMVEFVSGETGNLKRVSIDKETIRLGRDRKADVVLESVSAMVSRHHAVIRREANQCLLVDLASFNGTLLNDKRITTPTPLCDGDRIQLGLGGPVLHFIDPTKPAAAESYQAGRPTPHGIGAVATLDLHQTLKAESVRQQLQKPSAEGPGRHLLMQRSLGDKKQLTIGRAADNDIPLDGLQISKHHARLLSAGDQLIIEDTGSTNGVYVNGDRITGRRILHQSDIVQIGPFIFETDAQLMVHVFDTRSKSRIDAISLTKVVVNRAGGGEIKLLDGIDLTIQPNEFVGLLGPSGAGKTTLMDALNGMRPSTSGQVLINNLELYQHLDFLKQSIGYVPQENIIHRELTVYRTLYYVARLRLSRDVTEEEIDQIVNEVLDVTGLAERRELLVGQLSGGQRKRVSIAVELITKPSVIFLDEPTSGLDPATEARIMKLFRQIAESGRTVILTTHSVFNIRLFDKIAIVLRGKLVFYGTPDEALAFANAESFEDVYERLEEGVKERVARLPPLSLKAGKEEKRAFNQNIERISDEVAEEWEQRYQQTQPYRRNVLQPREQVQPAAAATTAGRRKTTPIDAFRQWKTLSRRYLEVLSSDKINLLILFCQGPIIGVLIYLANDLKAPRKFPYFMMALIPIWLGTSMAAREIIRERAVYNRERMVNLGLLPYVGSKLFVLSLIITGQCILLFATLKLIELIQLMPLPGPPLPQMGVMILVGITGVALGLFISAMVKTSEMATSLVPVVLIPQIMFSGIVGGPNLTKIGALVPVTWAYDELKRFTDAEDTLFEEGSEQGGPSQGRGQNNFIEEKNEKNVTKVKQDMEKYKKDADAKIKDFEQKVKNYSRDARFNPTLKPPEAPKLGPVPEVPKIEKRPTNLSQYVDFLHPWGDLVRNPLILLLMFLTLIVATVITLRAQDIR